MTREEQIDRLQNIIDRYEGEDMWQTLTDKRDYECIKAAIEALEQEPCGKDINVPATDAISRQAVLNILDDMVKDYIKENDFDKAQGVAWVKVQKLPPVTPQQKTGHWIEGGFDFNYWICSKCKYQPNNDYYKPSYKYCPNCGTKMFEPQESEDKE